MTRVVVTGCLGLLAFAACNTPQPAPTPRAPEAHTQAVVQEPAPSPVAAAAPGCCGGAACGAESEPGASCGGEAHSVAEQAQPAEPDRAAESADLAQLTRITDPSQVCMVRNHFMGRPQLSVALQGGTYFGCCAGCANRLLADPGARVAIDPVNHHTVDKALAVLAMTPRGSVLYFENELTFSAFRAGLN